MRHDRESNADKIKSMRRDIIAMARETAKTLTGSIDQIWEITRHAEVVFCVWQDDEQPGGYDVYVVKGEDRLHEIAIGKKPQRVRVAAIPCAQEQQAVWLKEAIEGTPRTLQ
jgi:hypothetical protein